MYKNLKKTLKELQIKPSFLSDSILNYPYQKYLSTRINNSTKFNQEEEQLIYSFLKSKGYKGTKSYLFEYSPEEKTIKSKPKTRLSSIIDKRMKELKISNKKLADEVLVSENTISNWRNGKVKSLDDMDSYMRLSKALNISVLYLLGDDSYLFEGRESDDLVNEHIITDSVAKQIMIQIFLFLNKVIGIPLTDLDLIKESRFLMRDEVINELYERVVPLFSRLIAFAKNHNNVSDKFFNFDINDLEDDEIMFRIFAKPIYESAKEKKDGKK